MGHRKTDNAVSKGTAKDMTVDDFVEIEVLSQNLIGTVTHVLGQKIRVQHFESGFPFQVEGTRKPGKDYVRKVTAEEAIKYFCRVSTRLAGEVSSQRNSELHRAIDARREHYLRGVIRNIEQKGGYFAYQHVPEPNTGVYVLAEDGAGLESVVVVPRLPERLVAETMRALFPEGIGNIRPGRSIQSYTAYEVPERVMTLLQRPTYKITITMEQVNRFFP